MLNMTNSECAHRVLESHRKDGHWTPRRVVADLLDQLGVDPAAQAANAAPIGPRDEDYHYDIPAREAAVAAGKAAQQQAAIEQAGAEQAEADRVAAERENDERAADEKAVAEQARKQVADDGKRSTRTPQGAK